MRRPGVRFASRAPENFKGDRSFFGCELPRVSSGVANNTQPTIDIPGSGRRSSQATVVVARERANCLEYKGQITLLFLAYTFSLSATLSERAG